MTTVDFKALPAAEAVAYFREKGFAPALARFSWKDVWADEHARMFTVAKVMRDDLLTEIRQALDDAISDGIPLAEFKKKLEPRLRAFGWWGKGLVEDPKTSRKEKAQLGSARRLDIIFDTNVRSAYSAGRWSRVERNKRLMPLLTYVQIDRPSKREAHEPFHGVTLPVEHDFWKTHWPPNGWKCGCVVRQISRRTAAREGLTETTAEELKPLLETRPFKNDRTGETVHVPIGVDPGFEWNAGMDRSSRSN